MACVKSKRRARTRTQRFTSNIFSMFNESQINLYKEAFNMVDNNKDGVVDKLDLVEIYTSLGTVPNDEELEDMLSQAPGQINFTMFLTLFGEKMMGCDPEESILNAFLCFDPDGTGYIEEETLRNLMTTMGNRWSDEAVDALFRHAPIKNNNFSYKEFIKTIVHGKNDKEAQET